jgi:hypothetical protein
MECEKWGRVLFGRDSEPISLTNFFVAPLFPLFYTTLNSLSELSVAYLHFHGSYFQANDLSIANRPAFQDAEWAGDRERQDEAVFTTQINKVLKPGDSHEPQNHQMVFGPTYSRFHHCFQPFNLFTRQ